MSVGNPRSMVTQQKLARLRSTAISMVLYLRARGVTVPVDPAMMIARSRELRAKSAELLHVSRRARQRGVEVRQRAIAARGKCRGVV